MKRIGRYEVVRALRAGGMGSVTLAKSPDGQLVVLKRPHALDDDAAVRLRDEARIGARLLHPAIVDTLDLFEENGKPVLVVAFVDGPSLEVLRGTGPLAPGAVARIGRHIAEGLAALHTATDEHGVPLHILHRDVTPGNIVISKEGDAKLIDLGIARFSERHAERTQEGFLRGTMRYLAPELLQGETYSPSSDLWALGMVLWEAALGRFAYRGESDREVLAGILRGEPMELDEGESVDGPLVAALASLLALSPAERTATAEEAAARFALLEEHYGDTGAITRRALLDALERKAKRDAAIKERIARSLQREQYVVGDDLFPDEATDAAVQRFDDDSAYDVPSARPSSSDEQVDEEPTLDLAPPARRDFEAAPTVAVPRPISLPSDGGEQGEQLDATIPLPTVMPREALRSDEQRRFPRVAADDLEEDTLSVSDPSVPRAALRSDMPDLEERADEFDDGTGLLAARDERVEPTLVSPAPVVVAVAAPAPEIDDDELEELHTKDGLSPVQPLAPAAQPVARIALVKRPASAAQVASGALPTLPDIDALPSARPLGRQERAADEVGLSPFHDETERIAAAPSSDARRETRQPKKKGQGKRKAAKRGAPVDDAPVDDAPAAEDPLEPTLVDAAIALPSSAFGARLVELPPSALPALPTISLDGLHDVATPAAHLHEPARERPPELRPRDAGEVMKLSDVAAFLEDD